MEPNLTRQHRLTRIFCFRFACFCTIALTTLLAPFRGLADNPPQHPSAPWLDDAVSAKQCPVMPVNLGADRESEEALLNRITISEGKLIINGTDHPDHIAVSAGEASNFVHVKWNGEGLGRFGPISGIVLRGNGGDDVLIIESGVHLPAVVDGGGGDDCVQGGSGGDQLFGGDGDDVLIAGTGRPALKGGSGNDRIIVPQHMGTLQFAPSADSGLLTLLGDLYDLQPMSTASASSNGTPSPIILGAADLAAQQSLSQSQSLLGGARTAGQSVVITNATYADSENLRLLLGHPNAATGSDGNQPGFGANGTAPLVFFRTTPRPGTQAFNYSTGFLASVPDAMDDSTIEWLSQIFSTTAIVPQAPRDSSSNDLLKLANSYMSTARWVVGGSPIQITNSAWAVRSFSNQADYYYFLQEVDYQSLESGQNSSDWVWTDINPNNQKGKSPIVIQTSPESTQCSESTTSSLTWSVGGSAGWNYVQIANATLTGGVSVTNSRTITCPNTEITNQTDIAHGVPYWAYSTNNRRAGTYTYYNQWIWQVAFSQYDEGQLDMKALASSDGLSMWSTVPLPFGDTFALQKPAVTSVSPACVNTGNTFTINGSGLYPSLLQGVSIYGTSAQYSSVSDTQLKVIAPLVSGYYLPVVVQTAEGQSNSNITIEISALGVCPSQ